MRDFYQRQEHAQSRTAYLVFLMIMGTSLTIFLGAVALSYFAVLWAHLEALQAGIEVDLWMVFLGAMCMSSLFVGGIVLAGALYKHVQLRRGGIAVAESLQAVLVEEGTVDKKSRRLLNVVQETAVAIGIPCPPVYVLENERGINALAAGYEPTDAIIAVTRGCLDRLSRDQLQGVIAHEYSHIVNGDMRLNTQALSVLHGNLSVVLVAEKLIQMGREMNMLARASSRNRGGGHLLMLVGAILWPIGQLGAFGAALITAGINRQREFLADASAVEFTRHPMGLADALKVIGGHTTQSRVRTPQASEVSHLFFASSLHGLARLFGTHPPLEERISRLDPEWDGVPIYADENDLPVFGGAFQGSMNFVAAGSAAECSGEPCDEDPAEFEWSGQTNHDQDVAACLAQWHAAQAERVAASVPAAVTEFVADAQVAHIAACGLVFGLDGILDETEASLLDDETRTAVQAFLPIIEQFDQRQRTYLLDRAIQSWTSTNNRQFGLLRRVEGGLGATWAERGWHWILQHHAWRRGSERPRVVYGDLQQVADSCEIVLSSLVAASGTRGMMAEYGFRRAAAHFGVDELEYYEFDEPPFDEFFASLDVLAKTSAECRRKLLLGCSLALTSDGQITQDEAVLIRVVCLTLGFPLPTLLPGDRVMAGV